MLASVVRAIPAVGCVRVRVVCWVGNGSRDLPKGSSMGATLAFRRTGMCIAPPTWHMRCAAWYYKYRCMLFCNPSSRESGTLVITESFGLRHQEEPCACGEPRVSQDNIWRPTWVVICPSVGFFFVQRGERWRFAIIFRKSLFIFSACYLCCCVVFSPVRALCLSCA